jgi:hypothetical protein
VTSINSRRTRTLEPPRPGRIRSDHPRAPGAGGLAADAQRALSGVAGGRLASLPFAVRFWDGSVIQAADGDEPEVPTLVIRDRRAIRQLLHEPSEVGLTRAWVEQSLDLDGELERVLAARNRYSGLRLSALGRLRLALAAVRAAGVGVLAFYRLLLGPSIVYSCAYFEDPADSLEEAQERKLEIICRKLRLAPGERLLDVGCGWGSLLLHAARHPGARTRCARWAKRERECGGCTCSARPMPSRPARSACFRCCARPVAPRTGCRSAGGR